MRSIKALKLFKKTYFQIKVNKSVRCYNLGPRRIPWGNFRGNRCCCVGGRFSCCFHILFKSRTLQNWQMEALCSWKNLCSWKIKSGTKSLVKKKKQNKTTTTTKRTGQRRKKEYHSVKKRIKIPMWKRLVLSELHAGVQISNKEVAVKPKFAINDVKNKVSFSLCKYQPWYKNINNCLES